MAFQDLGLEVTGRRKFDLENYPTIVQDLTVDNEPKLLRTNASNEILFALRKLLVNIATIPHYFQAILVPSKHRKMFHV